jgi:GTP-binding protein
VKKKIPAVHILGKPNVGKSTLFNRLIKRKKAIVDDIPGVTRDAVVGEVRFDDRTFSLIDTCGLFGDPDGIIEEKMWDMATKDVDAADLVLFVVDGSTSPTSEDYKVVEFLRSKGVHPLLVANKAESENKYVENLAELYQLGMGDPIQISAAHGYGVYDLCEEILEKLKDKFELYESEETKTEEDLIEEEVVPNIAIVGKPNVGKSSLFNQLLGKERSMVTDIAGTTRDTIDDEIELYGKKYNLIDTAGIRRKNRVKYYTIESYSILRAQQAIERSDVCVIMMDVNERISDQDKKIAGFAENAGKACVLAFNKCDLLSEKDKEQLYPEVREDVEIDFYFLPYSKTLFISALERTGIKKLFDAIDEAYRSFSMEFSTGEINAALERINILVPPPSPKGKRIKMYYATQVSTKPPVIQIFCNYPELVPDNYKKAVKKNLRKFLGPMPGSPLFLKFVSRRKDK